MKDYRELAAQSNAIFGYRPSLELLRYNEIPKYEVRKTKEFIPILNTEPDQSGKPIYLDLSKKTVSGGCSVVIFANTGSGKTTLLLGMISELLNAGYIGAAISDLKSDMYYTGQPLQQHYRKWLPPWRTPQPLPVKSYVPYFVARRKGIKPGQQIGQLQITDLTKDDIRNSILNVKEKDAQDNIINGIWEDEVHGIEPPKTIQEFLDRIKDANIANILKRLNLSMGQYTYHIDSLRSLLTKFSTVYAQKVMGEEFKMDFVRDMLNGYFPALSLNELVGPSMDGYSQTYMASLIRKIYREKTNVNGLLGPIERKVFLTIDDAGRVAMPSGSNPTSKQEIENLISLGRNANIFTFIVAQSLQQLSEESWGQVKYVIFFKTVNHNDVKELAKVRGIKYPDLRERLSLRGPQRPTQGDYAGARSVLIWRDDGDIQMGWVPMPPCSIPEA